ncbi:uncharacterized protein PHALS_14956 [Plasmopara halstedii]|uniref:Uncharacterized protein n=1 Tax=Plasmopara halstedii TaxID=4781 RepID=A0A0N7L7H1_PLAHL|nr:uncharacterized protein PHALS_14956 [Plasmopara halstedii]CEG47059.1 hypothetical protein PHALS_14956 [Plasmopara halstedii]|eukprot:XP_024583428.1 hypothetical protein PHALS_14956 [Plasmopara halstedii]
MSSKGEAVCSKSYGTFFGVASSLRFFVPSQTFVEILENPRSYFTSICIDQIKQHDRQNASQAATASAVDTTLSSS